MDGGQEVNGAMQGKSSATATITMDEGQEPAKAKITMDQDQG